MRYFVIIFFIGLAFNSTGQRKLKPGTDSVHVKGKSFLVLKDTSIFIPKDTILVLPDSVVARIRKDREGNSAAGYLKLKEKLSKRKVTKEIYDLLFKDPPASDKKQAVQKKQVATDDFENYTGRVIRSIQVKKLKPFGTRITDTTRQAKDWFSKAANNLHADTRTRIIKNNLFFEEGDNIDPDLLRDSERILRTFRFLRDARIYIVPNNETFEVDVLVITRDVWSLTGSFSYDGVDDFDFSVAERNFLGLGHEIEIEFPYDEETDPVLGYLATYTVNNIKNTFITAEATHGKSQPFDRNGLRVFRNFITPYIKYGGGVEFARERLEQARVFEDTTIVYNVEYNLFDYWLGRSFLIAEDEESRTNFQVAYGYERTNYLDRPIVRSDTNQTFYDRSIHLVSLGISKRGYERSSMIIGYGRTEDIPMGYLAEVTVGREQNQFNNRTYLSSILSYGNYLPRIGYVRPSLTLGTFIENKRTEQVMIRPSLSYFSYLYRVRRTSFRQFFTLTYTLGKNRFTDEFVNINNTNGVRGLSDVFLRGTKKLALQAETVAFTPLYFAGFRMAIFGFFDLAVVNAEDDKLLKNPLYQGYGLGLRFRNENLAFNTFQIRLAWYPNTPPGVSGFDFDLAGQQRLNIQDFRVERPRVLPFE